MPAMVEVLGKLRERGVKRIYVACTHSLFTAEAIGRIHRGRSVSGLFDGGDAHGR